MDIHDTMKDATYKEMVRYSGRISHQALTLLRKLGLPNIPPCYHVAYNFYNQGSEQPSSNIAKLTGSPTEILNDVQDIYSEIIAAPDEREMINFASRFQQLTKSMTSDVKNGQQHLKQYAAYLNDIKPFLETGTESEVLDVTTLLIKETESVHRYAQELENQLESATCKITTLKEEHSRFRQQANRDPLTGTLNRTGLQEGFDNISQDENQFPISVLLLDIDDFKQFNDRYGHLVGDRVLKVVSNTLRKNIKGFDIISRFGGEEFLILLLNTSSKNGSMVAEHLRKLIEKLRIKHRKTDEYLAKTTISIGVSELCHGAPLLESIDLADQALYRAKSKQKNCVVLG